jgi:hypothetical protein
MKKLLQNLKARFEQNQSRHPDLSWTQVQARLEANPEKLRVLSEMERTGGEPDVVGEDSKTGEYIFFDCSTETPGGRLNLCYDREAQDARKQNKPAGNALEIAAAIGAELLTERQYRELQKLGEFDTKTSSWIKTPADIRTRGGALFAERRYRHVFTFHNGAQSYFSSRGFRCSLRV